MSLILVLMKEFLKNNKSAGHFIPYKVSYIGLWLHDTALLKERH